MSGELGEAGHENQWLRAEWSWQVLLAISSGSRELVVIPVLSAVG